MTFKPEKIPNKAEEDQSVIVDIFYIRHGKPEGQYANDQMPYSEFQAAIDHSKSLNIKLSAEGREQVLDAVTRAKLENEQIKLILSSPYRRAQETAEIAQQYIKDKQSSEIPIRTSELLKEIDLDPDLVSEEEYDKLIKKDGFWGVMKKFDERWLGEEKGAHETAEQSYKRAQKLIKFLRRIRKMTRHDKILIVSHGWFGRVIQHVAQKGKPQSFFEDTDLIKTAGMYGFEHSISDDEFILVEIEKDDEE